MYDFSDKIIKQKVISMKSSSQLHIGVGTRLYCTLSWVGEEQINIIEYTVLEGFKVSWKALALAISPF